ncbi:MAG: hypothetical protein ABJ092_14850 [Gillisia sp.]
MKKNYFENEIAKMWIEDGILYFEYKPGTFINLEVARKIVESRLEMQGTKAYPVFCDIRGITSSTKTARDYLANEGSILVKAMSALSLEHVSSGIVDFYIQTNKPRVPTKIFTSKYLALKFLEQYRDKNVD